MSDGKRTMMSRTTILHPMNQKLPVLLDILNHQISFTSSQSGTHSENISSACCSFVLQREPSEGNAWPHHKKGEQASVIRNTFFFFYSRYVSHQTKNPKIIPNIYLCFTFVVVPDTTDHTASSRIAS